QGTGDLADLLLAVAIFVPGAAHQLQVVDDDETDIVLVLEPAAFGPELEDVQGRRIIDEDRRLGEPVDPLLVQLFHLMLLEAAAGDLFHEDLGFGTEDTLNQLRRAHFKAEKGYGRRLGGIERSIAGQVESESRFTYRRPCRQDDQIGTLPAIGYLVQRWETAGYPGDLVLLVPQVFDALDGLHQHGVDAIEILTQVVIGDLEELAFGVVEQVENIRAVLIGVADDLATDPDQLALDEFLQDDARVGLDVGGRHHRIGELGNIVCPPDDIQLLTHLELFDYGKDIDGLALLRQALHGTIDALMALQVKTFRFKDLHNRIECTLFQHDSTEYRLLQLLGLGRYLTIYHGA